MATGADSELAYLYDRQLAEAELIAVNKTDTAAPELVAAVLADAGRRYPAARLVRYSARAGSVAELLDPAGSDGAAEMDLDVDLDYDRYAAAEAELAWLNRAVEVTAPAGFAPAAWAVAALTAISRACAAAGVLIGHAKLAVTGPDGGLATASVVAAGARPEVDRAGPDTVPTARAVINLRVAWDPEKLDRAAVAAIATADSRCGTRSTGEPGPAVFRPAYPRPTHRLTAG